MRTAGSCAVSLVLLVTAPASAGDGLVAHKATYEVVVMGGGLQGTTYRSPVLIRSVAGSACKGWDIRLEFRATMVSERGAMALMIARDVLEGPAGSRLRVSSEIKVANVLNKERIVAARLADGTVKVSPEGTGAHVLMNPNTLFPIQHIERTLAAARSNVSVFVSDLYDGRGHAAKAKVEITTLPATDIPPAVEAFLGSLGERTGWQLKTVLTQPAVGGAKPATETTETDLYPGGIVGRLAMVLDGLQLVARVRTLEPIPPKTACPPAS